MWVFTEFGFFSIVAHRDKPGHLLVRSRCEADVRALATKLKPRPRVTRTPKADYLFRVTVPRAALGELLQATTADIAYDNFKSAVARAQGPERAHLYHDVWRALLPLQAGSRRELDGGDGFPW